ncbi:MAG: HAD-superfamily hydrolase, subfamily [Phycisphaerales bacterium]|nr:HAD-superfamily hydrolase, subfamily [Phycisphaerales bacterium]
MLIDFDVFDAVLLDLDGTVYHEEHALPGAVELVRQFEARRRKFACLTNSTSSPDRIGARLARMGIAVHNDCIYTAAAATVDYVLETFTNPRIYNLATEGIHEMLDGKVTWVPGEDGPCDAVICGVPLSVYATDERRRTAMLHVRRGSQLVAICADRVYPSPRGLEFGVGALAAMLAYAADVQPVFCGKPERHFFDDLCKRLGVAPNRCVLIGDNLESDIAGAKGVGMKTVLTLTGVSTREDAERLPAAARPDWIIQDLTELL